ncbi:hypothetical protein [Planctomycetes bacterium K23_9]|uniref:Uncharacterized protein n=1 Tax=Stieleria marina TaxID=1930275 RepID=A0A517NT10_9BACT|nr:hypothetical protein K239x_22230 [Planctomycetes bacterium K23_9]
MRHRITTLLIVCVTFASAVNAHEPPKTCETYVGFPSTHVVSRHCDSIRPRRIVVVTCPNRQDRLKEQDLFARFLAAQIGRNTNIDVLVGKEQICRDHMPMRRGTFDELHLLQLSKKYQADCVMFCEIGQLSAYEPMQAEMSMLLVHVGESIALVSAKSVYDARDSTTNKSYLAFINQANPESALSVGAHTPTNFIEFASSHFASGIESIW